MAESEIKTIDVLDTAAYLVVLSIALLIVIRVLKGILGGD